MVRTINFPGLANQATRDQAEQAVFGNTIANNDLYGDLAGDFLRDATVNVTYNDHIASKNKTFRIKIRASNAFYASTVRINPNEFEYSECTTTVAGTGIARFVLHLVAMTARAHNFASLLAAGSKFPATAVTPATNGYYTYPKYGFDEAIPGPVLALITPQQNAALQGRATVLQLMADAVGRAFWRANGVQLNNMVFDLTPGSVSWQRLCTLPSP